MPTNFTPINIHNNDSNYDPISLDVTDNGRQLIILRYEFRSDKKHSFPDIFFAPNYILRYEFRSDSKSIIIFGVQICSHTLNDVADNGRHRSLKMPSATVNEWHRSLKMPSATALSAVLVPYVLSDNSWVKIHQVACTFKVANIFTPILATKLLAQTVNLFFV